MAMITFKEQFWLAAEHGQTLETMEQVARDNPNANLKDIDEAIKELKTEREKFYQLTDWLK